MSWLSSALKGAGHAVGGVLDNKWTKLALAAGLTATGVGAPAGAAIMAGEGLLGGALHNGGGLHDGLVGGATGAATGAAAGLAGKALYGGLGAVGSGSGLSGAAGTVGKIAGGLGGVARSALGGLAGGGAGGGGGLSLPTALLGGAGVLNAAQLGKTSNDYAGKAWDLANDSYASRAGLRAQGIESLLHPQAPQTQGLTALRAQNGVARRALGAGTPPSAPPAPSTPPVA